MTSIQQAELPICLLTTDRDHLQPRLEIFLNSSACPEYSMNFYQLDGYLCAIVGAGCIVPSEIWLPLIFADKKPCFKNDQEFISVISMLISLYNFHVNQVLDAQCNLPCRPIYSNEKNERINIEQWARGFMQGFILANDYNNSKIMKNPSLDENIETIYDEIDATISIVSAVADAEYAAQNGMLLNDIALMFSQLPDHVVRYGQLGSKLRKTAVEFCRFIPSTWPKPSASLVWT